MRIRVFLVEDSGVQAEVIRRRLGTDGDIEVIGLASTGQECLRQVPILRPDVVVMDGCLPEVSGPDVTAKLLEVFPVPVILFTESPEQYKNLAELSGAVATVSKNPAEGEPLTTLIRVIRLMNGMKVVRRKPPLGSHRGTARKFLLIGSSSGGPVVVKQVLEEVKPSSGLTVVLVQHLSEAGTHSFVDWLGQVTDWPCRLSQDNEIPKPGHAYLGPAGHHLVWRNGLLRTQKARPGSSFAPSVDELFTSFAGEPARSVIALVISGMGEDGARGLLNLRLAGATTLAQDPTTAAVSGMPEAAIAWGGAVQIVPTEHLGRVILAAAHTPSPPR